MDDRVKKQIGARIRLMRENAGYTREKFGELCGLSPRFIANVELGDATFSLDSLITVCRVLSCSSDYVLFGDTINADIWSKTISRLEHTDKRYQPTVDKALQGILESIIIAENKE